mmetsp:Transcript_30701/g.57367  ORF Transcript_30701/g.57367 Transcript_30701/m.57367 type:complete len:341 (-) Transcript_30701:186-1208(-)
MCTPEIYLDAGARPLSLGRGGHGLALDATFIPPADDAEVALLAPVRVPAVGHLPVFHSAVHAPADNTHGMAAEDLRGSPLVDARHVVLEVRVDGESRLNRSVGHDGLLEGLFARVGLWATGVGVTGRGEVVVRSLGARVTGLWACRRRGGWASRRALIWVRIRTLGAVVVAVGEGEGRAEASVSAERTSAVVLSSSDESRPGNVAPCKIQESASTAVRFRAEAHLLRREGDLHLAARGDAKAVRGGFGSSERPAATTVALVADVTDDLGAFRPVGFGIEIRRNAFGSEHAGVDHLDRAVANELLHALEVARLDPAKLLRSVEGKALKTVVEPRLPGHARN